MKQYGALDDTIYFWFAGNDTSGSGGDGASPTADVRLAGAAADAAPVYSPTPVLLSHVNYPAGAYEIAVPATAANGHATGNTYAIFCALAIDSQNPTGFVGSFDLKPVESNLTQIGDSTQSATDFKDFADAGYDPATNKVQGVVLTDTCTTNTDMVGTDNAALAATALTDVTWTDAKAGYLDHSINTVDGVCDGIQTDLSNGTDGLGALKTTIETRSTVTTAQVNTEVADVIKTDTSSEPSQGAPPSTPTLEEMITYLYFKMRNKGETTSSEDAMFDDAGTTKVMKSAISDDNTTFTKGEYISGA